LSDENRRFLDQVSEAKPVVKLECGYATDEVLPVVFQGEVLRVVEHFEGPTRITKLMVKAGASNIAESYSVKTYRSGTSLEVILKELISDMKLPYGTVYIPRVASNSIVIDKNFYASGKTIDIIKSLCDNYDLVLNVARVSVVNIFPSTSDDRLSSQPEPTPTDQLTERGFSSRLIDTQEIGASRADSIRKAINDFDNASPERKGYRINKDVGFLISSQDNTLVGYPALESGNEAQLENETKKGSRIRFKTLMNGFLEVGKRVSLQSRFESGVYVIEKLRYQGEFEGSDWYVDCTGVLVDDWTVSKQQ
jgi:hypothetical protein